MMAAACPATALSRPSTLERAFELARGGAFETVDELAAILKRENHDSVIAHLAGPSVRRDLRRALQAGHANRGEGG